MKSDIKQVCERCGYCSICGRSNYPVYPYPWYSYTYPYITLAHATYGMCWCGVWHLQTTWICSGTTNNPMPISNIQYTLTQTIPNATMTAQSTATISYSSFGA